MFRRILLTFSALALACVGILGTEGVAHAGKVVVDGSLDCTASGFTTITPGLVISIPPIQRPNKPDKPGKDKKPKYVSSGTSSGCTGTSSQGVTPTSVTNSTGKSKGLSRALVQPASSCGAAARVAKVKI